MAIFWKKDSDGNFEYISEAETVDPERAEKLGKNDTDMYHSGEAYSLMDEIPPEAEYVTITVEEYAVLSEMLVRLSDYGWNLNEVFEKMSENTYKFQKQLRTVESLNENLKRIMRERANARRGIPNKKEHSGFLVLRSEVANRLLKTRREHDYRMLYKTTIQTPYEASLPQSSMMHLYSKEIKRIYGMLGIRMIPKDKDVFDFVDKLEDGKPFIANVAYEVAFRANYERGFWEQDLYHTLPIVVPEELRKPPKVR